MRFIALTQGQVAMVDDEDYDWLNKFKTLDNRRENLRPATDTQNMMNRRRSRSSTSGYKGVSWHKYHGKWCAQISLAGKDTHLGYFHDPAEAYAAYREAATKHYGEFARFQ